MVMVRLNHVTTRYDPRHYQTRADLSPIATRRGPMSGGRAAALHPLPDSLPGPTRPIGEKVLDDLCLTILHGETLSVIGPSGCGKSTLLRVIAGLIRPEAGDLFFDGQPVNGQSPRDRRVGMVFQNYALYPHMAVEDNMGFFWRLRRRQEQEVTAKVRQVAQLLRLDIGALLGRFPRHLSG